MNEKKRIFEPNQFVKLFNGQVGVVLGPEAYQRALKALKQGNKPGRYFAPGCCQHPDYVMQIPVLFEDGTWDVMRAMNLRPIDEPPEDRKKKIEASLANLEQD